MGGFGKIGSGLAAIGGFIPVYGQAVAALGAVAAALDAEDTSGNVILPQNHPWDPYGYLWGVALAKGNGWSDLWTGRTDYSYTDNSDQIVPFTDFGQQQRMTGAEPKGHAALAGVWLAMRPGSFYMHGNSELRSAAVATAIERGSPERIIGSATLVESYPTGAFHKGAKRIQFGELPLGHLDNALVNFRAPYGGPVIKAKELLDRWAATMQTQAKPDFSAYLDNRGWLDSPWTSGGGAQTWEENVRLVGSWAGSWVPVPQIPRADWIAGDPEGHRSAWAARLQEQMAQWDADAEAWHDWRFEAKVQLAEDTAKKELTSAFEGYVDEALAAGLSPDAAMQYAMNGLAVQIGGTPAPPAVPDFGAALAQAQAAFGALVFDEVMDAIDAGESVTPDTPPSAAPTTKAPWTGLAAAAAAAGAAILLTR